MDKNKYFVEEPDNTDNSSKQGSDGELFVSRVASSGVVLKFKVGKNGALPSSSNVLTHELTFGERQNASGPLEYIDANCNQSMSVQSLEIRNAGPRNNISFLDSTMGTSNQDAISKVEMVNNSSKEVDQMASLKSVAMDTCMAGTNETNSSQNVKIYSTENVTDGIYYRGNHEASASEKTFSCPNEEHICHQCDKRFQSIDSLYGHMGCHRRDEYKLIRTMIKQPLVTNTSMIDMQEVKKIWKASQALIKKSMLSGRHPVHSTKATIVTSSSKDISGDTIQIMEVADLLIKLSQTVGENVVKVPSSPSVGVFMCRTCNKIFDSFQALGGHMSIHNKPKKTHQLVDNASNPSGSGELQNWKLVCCKCNERFLTGQSLGGHKRKHWFEEHRVTPTTDGNVKAPLASLPHCTTQSPGALLLLNDELQSTETDLKGVEGSVCMQAPKTYEAVQPLQTNSLVREEELPSGVVAIVADVEAELPPSGRTLPPKANDKEP